MLAHIPYTCANEEKKEETTHRFFSDAKKKVTKQFFLAPRFLLFAQDFFPCSNGNVLVARKNILRQEKNNVLLLYQKTSLGIRNSFCGIGSNTCLFLNISTVS